MDDKILAVDGLRADILNAIGHAEDPHQQLSDAEVITTGLVAMGFFRGHCEAARALWRTPRYGPHRRSRRRVNRRLHRLPALFVMLCDLCGCTWKPRKTAAISGIDRFPVAVCAHDRIPRAKVYREKRSRGCMARKQRYCYGRNMPLLVTTDGQPVECCLTPGS